MALEFHSTKLKRYCRDMAVQPVQKLINGGPVFSVVYTFGADSIAVNYPTMQGAQDAPRCITVPAGSSIGPSGQPVVESGPPDQFYPAPDELRSIFDLVAKTVGLAQWRLSTGGQEREAKVLAESLATFSKASAQLSQTLARVSPSLKGRGNTQG